MSHALTKSELIERVFQKHGSLTNREADTAVNLLLNTIVQSLGQGKRVEIRNFGSFSLRLRKSRMARNPRTGESVPVESKYIPMFKAGAELKEAVNNSFLGEKEKSND